MILALPNQELVIQENHCFYLKNYRVEVLAYLGLLSEDVHSFKVKINSDDNFNTEQLGLLRVGAIDGGLSRELQLREVLGDYGMVAPLLAHTVEESVALKLSCQITNQETEWIEKEQGEQLEAIAEDVDENSPDISLAAETSSEQQIEPPEQIEPTSEYLEEEYYPEKEIGPESQQKLILLTDFPEGSTLETWLTGDNSPEKCLSLAVQICQGFSYVFQRGWCFANLLPQLIQIGTPLKFFDLTTAYPVGEKPSLGLIGDYCAPELASGYPFDETMSTYTVGALLYQAIHQQPPPSDQPLNIEIQPIPHVHQLLKISLSPICEERFSLAQLLTLLVSSRNSFRTPEVRWNIASRSTVGLSTDRLQNEDSYGVQQQLSNTDTYLLAAVADGMGGMSQGEVASKLAIQTVLSEPIPPGLKSEQRADWLISLFEQANQATATAVRDGGTTLSVVMASANQLAIAHVGDSRIYLVRKGEIRQLSEDHTLVAMLVASGQITDEESLNHPERSVLIKSLGSKQQLSSGYVQDLSRTAGTRSMILEDEDLLLLCSDGVWDLVSPEELAEIFTCPQYLQSSVDRTIELVLKRGAADNATLLALQCRIKAN
ncbi:MAG: protein phosphatase 2C domain-containing protein [Cyanophyceae cyanobacterium]